MKVFKEDNRLPIKMWCNDVEDNAMEQAINLSNLPFAFKHIALMPDCHFGYGMPIGGVMATKDVIIPNAVGVDISCGICAIKTNFTHTPNTETIKKIMKAARSNIPVGKRNNKEARDLGMDHIDHSEVVTPLIPNAEYALGSLGSGNHFIEIQQETSKNNNLWIMIHSGSRNLGYKIAKHYNTLAREINKKWYSQVLDEWELAFLPIDSEEGINYITDMNFATEFAFRNRQKMMFKMMEIVKNCFQKYDDHKVSFQDEMINIHHNYASLENHYGENVWVHRKGATLARKDTIGIIPGSQGTKSYIVKGKGNPESFMSCSHGAGRVLGRKQAVRELDFASVVKKLDDKGIVHSIRNTDDLEEAPEAYKDINEVMENQKDLVEILTELRPLAVIKG